MRSSLFVCCLLFMLVPVAAAHAEQCQSFQHFGATDNDLADDDTIAIRNALTSGLPICFKGTFRITSEIVMNVPINGGAFITGFGRQTSKLILDGPSIGIKIVLATPNRLSTPQAVLRDFSLVPKGAITSNTYQAALAVTTAGGSGMTDPTFDMESGWR